MGSLCRTLDISERSNPTSRDTGGSFRSVFSKRQRSVTPQMAARLTELLNKFRGSTDTGVPIEQRLILSLSSNIPFASLESCSKTFKYYIWFLVGRLANFKWLAYRTSIGMSLGGFAEYSNWATVVLYLFNYWVGFLELCSNTAVANPTSVAVLGTRVFASR